MTAYLDENFYDHQNQAKHCGSCGEVVYQHDRVLKDHVICTWRHYVWTDFPGVLAVGDQGKIIEGVFAQPPRRLLTLLPYQNAVWFCQDCFTAKNQGGCAQCEDSVNTDEPHSTVEILFKHTDGYNHSFTKLTYHHDCLPSAMDLVRAKTKEQKTKEN